MVEMECFDNCVIVVVHCHNIVLDLITIFNRTVPKYFCNFFLLLMNIIK